jgi:hypothetical protein
MMVSTPVAYPVHTIATNAWESAPIVPNAYHLLLGAVSITLVHVILGTMMIRIQPIASHALIVVSDVLMG